MIKIQGFKQTTDSIMIILDKEGIDQLVGYLSFIKTSESSMHLNIGNELDEDLGEMSEGMFQISHLKIINVDNLE